MAEGPSSWKIKKMADGWIFIKKLKNGVRRGLKMAYPEKKARINVVHNFFLHASRVITIKLFYTMKKLTTAFKLYEKIYFFNFFIEI